MDCLWQRQIRKFLCRVRCNSVKRACSSGCCRSAAVFTKFLHPQPLFLGYNRLLHIRYDLVIFFSTNSLHQKIFLPTFRAVERKVLSSVSSLILLCVFLPQTGQYIHSVLISINISYSKSSNTAEISLLIQTDCFSISFGQNASP